MGSRPISICVKRIRFAGVALAAISALTAVLPLSSASAEGTHTVAQGDTAWTIAVRYGISLADLVAINELSNPDRIYVGERLVVTGGSTSVQTPVASQPKTAYTVAPGDSLSGIAQAHGVLLADLVTANGIANPDWIQAGQQLVIPGGGGAIPASFSIPSSPVYVTRAEAEAAVRAAADEFGIPRGVLLALAYQESGFQQHVRSRVGAIGLMQIMPETADWAIGFLIYGDLDVRGSATDNARVGAAIFAHLLDLSGGDVDTALAAYYQGWYSVSTYGPLQETYGYVANIRYFQRLFE